MNFIDTSNFKNIIIPADVLKVQGISAIGKLVFGLLLSFTHETGRCKITYKKLRTLLKHNSRPIVTAIEVLEKLGYIEVNRTENQFGRTILYITMKYGGTNNKLMECLYKTNRPQEKKMKRVAGYVYLLEKDGFYKIGKTINPKKRLYNYKTESVEKLNVLCCCFIKNYSSLEKSLHKKYHYFKVRGEWFELGQREVKEVIEFLEERDIEHS